MRTGSSAPDKENCFAPDIWQNCFAPDVWQNCFAPDILQNCFGPDAAILLCTRYLLRIEQMFLSSRWISLRSPFAPSAPPVQVDTLSRLPRALCFALSRVHATLVKRNCILSSICIRNWSQPQMTRLTYPIAFCAVDAQLHFWYQTCIHVVVHAEHVLYVVAWHTKLNVPLPPRRQSS